MESDSNYARRKAMKGLFVVASRSGQARRAPNATFLRTLVIRGQIHRINQSPIGSIGMQHGREMDAMSNTNHAADTT